MTPFQLAQEHPQLWHVTAAEAVDAVLAHGLSSTAELLVGCDLPPEEKERLLDSTPAPSGVREPSDIWPDCHKRQRAVGRKEACCRPG